MLKPITEIKELEDKRVFVRVDWNVPMGGGQIVDDYRIKKTLPTIEYLRDKGAKVKIATHLEPDTASTEILFDLVPDGVDIMPNLRDNAGEVANSPEFAAEIAEKFDIYVNEAFGVSHREHASIVTLPKLLPSFAGMQFIEEVENLSKAFNPPKPFLFILGGAKFETKVPLVNKFLDIADQIAIFGANAKPAYEMFKDNPKITFPLGDIAALDADEANINLLREKVKEANFIVWNGPLGKYEDGYKEGTEKLAKILAESGKEVIVGGADTLATIKELNLLDKFSFVSTGGGAMLTFLATGTLPGIEALR